VRGEPIAALDPLHDHDGVVDVDVVEFPIAGVWQPMATTGMRCGGIPPRRTSPIADRRAGRTLSDR
jgi:hypothetical protein